MGRLVSRPILVNPKAAAQKSNISENQQDDDNHQDQAEAAGRIITPTAAVRPMGKRPDQEQQDDD